jgi:hypothetical protein
MVRRVIAALVVASVLVPASIQPVRAEGAFSGVVVDAHTGAALGGVIVAVADTAGRPIRGLRTVTSGTGSFSIGGLDGEEYSLVVNGTLLDYEAGYLSGAGGQPFGRRVVESYDDAATWAPTNVGRIGLERRFFSGRVVDAATGRPIVGVEVMATGTNGGVLLATSDVTSADGAFRVAGGLGEEHGLWFDGSSASFEVGYLGQIGVQPHGRPVVSTWDDAVTWSPFATGRVGLQALAAPGPLTFVRLRSMEKRAVTLLVVESATGGPASSYRVQCTSGLTTVRRTYDASGQTRFGFLSGTNTCRARAVNTTGVGPWSQRTITVR